MSIGLNFDEFFKKNTQGTSAFLLPNIYDEFSELFSNHTTIDVREDEISPTILVRKF